MNRIVSISILLFISSSISNAEVYKWVDDNGKVHYGDKAPNDVIAPLDTKDLPAINSVSSGNPDRSYSPTSNIESGYGEYPSNKHSISGKLIFDGKPIKVSSVGDVYIWMRDEGAGKAANIQVKYNVMDSSIYVDNLTPGEYGMSVNVDKNKSNGHSYPGDYRAWANFNIRNGYSIKRDINLEKVIHLTAPQNNNKIIKGWNSPCDKKVALDSPVMISWKSLGHNVSYQYVIRNNPCEPFKFGDIIKQGETTETFVALDLPETEQNHQYMLDIKAYRDNRLIGSLITHGDNGFGWDYRFSINKIANY